jgi:enolase
MIGIKSIFGYEVLDSRGYPTVACIVKSTNGHCGKAMVPSGASTGEREALELRDGDKNRYMGKGVLKAVNNLNKIIAPKLIAKKFDITDQNKIDKFMIDLDGTSTKSKLGANAILAVSLAVARCASNALNKPLYKYISENLIKSKETQYTLPVPMLNVINGGAHADNTIDFQEFMFMPISAKSMHEACKIASECFHSLAKLLRANKYNTSKGDEGGFAPLLKDADQALSYMVKAVENAGYKPGIKNDVAIALDVAASELYDGKNYIFHKAIANNLLSKKEGTKTTDQMVSYLKSLVKKYPIISIEDGLAEND